MKPRVSVILVTYNSADEIDGCLAALAQQVEVPHQVIAVDNCSQDETRRLLQQHPQVHLILSKQNVGFAAAVNTAAAAATGEYLLLLNPDALLRPQSLQRLVTYLDAHPQVGIAAPRIYTADGRLRDNTFAYETIITISALTLGVGPLRRLHGRLLRPRQPWRFRADTPQRIDAAIGAVLLIRRELFTALDGLDERFFLYCEDGDFCLRAARRGSQTHLVPQAAAAHIGGASTPAGTYRLTGMIGRHLLQSRYRYVEKHYGRAAAIALRGLFAVAGAAFSLLSRLLPAGPRRDQLREHGRLLRRTPR
jgi:N-acetylglucosaminyl-diphospho-decaprenol L-rhamnosyltransferase